MMSVSVIHKIVVLLLRKKKEKSIPKLENDYFIYTFFSWGKPLVSGGISEVNLNVKILTQTK